MPAQQAGLGAGGPVLGALASEVLVGSALRALGSPWAPERGRVSVDDSNL